MTTYTARVICPDDHTYYLELINPRQREDGTITGYLSSSADFCNCGKAIEADPVILGDGKPVNTGPQKIGVWLSSEELGLLRAGLAAHSIALDKIPVSEWRQDETLTDAISRRGKETLARQEVAAQQKKACRELSLRLGDAQIQVNG